MGKPTKEEIFAAAAREHVEFQRAIGALVLNFANLESALYSVLRYYAGVSHKVGRAIFSGSRRANTMIGFIRAIAHNTNMDPARRKDLEDVFVRINEINTMRDLIVHHVDGSEQEFDEDDPTTRYLNVRFVSRQGNEKRIKIGSALIDAMSADALACCWRLVAHPDNTNDPFKPGHGPTGKPHTWLYRSPLQDSPAKQTPSSAQRSPRQRKPSRG